MKKAILFGGAFILLLVFVLSGCSASSKKKKPRPEPSPSPGPADTAWSIAQVGDIHAPAFILKEFATNLAPFILAHTNDGVFNIKVFVSAGDVYEQDTNVVHSPPELGWPVAWMQADFDRLKTNGIMVVLANGNHDCDTTIGQPGVCAYCGGVRASNPGMMWNSIFPISFFNSQKGFIGTKVAGDSHNLIMSYTNGTKVLFLTYKTLSTSCDPLNDYVPQTEWITNTAAQYPDHNVMVVGHFFINNELQLGFTDSPGLNNIGPGGEPFIHESFPLVSNLLFCVGGHDRRLRKQHLPFPAKDGHTIDIVAFNTQGSSKNGAFINLFTFQPLSGTVKISTYDIIAQRFLTNNNVSLLNNLGAGQPHEWTVPFAVTAP